VRRRLAWIAGGLGLAALARAVRKRRREAAVPAAPAAPDPAAPAAPDPAEELRTALAETKVPKADEPTEAPEEPPSLEERRRKVHERAQEAIDAINDPPPGA
jgi:hypothetical protein